MYIPKFNCAIISPDQDTTEHYSKELSRSSSIGTRGAPLDEFAAANCECASPIPPILAAIS